MILGKGKTFDLFCPFQKAWLNDKAPLKLGEKSRRIGWTWMEAFDAVTDSAAGVNGNYYISSVDATATGEFIGYCDDWAQMINAVARISDEQVVIEDEKVTQKVMTFANGARIVAGSSNPKFFRSKGGRCAWDEAAFHDNGQQMYKAMHASSQFWGYPARIWSSQNGEQSYFNWLIEEAKNKRLQASLHKVTILDAVEQGIVERIRMRQKKLAFVPAPDAKARQEWLDQMRATCPDQATWDEEYLCIPSSGGRSFLPADLIRTCEEPNLVAQADLGRWLENWTGGSLYAGFDVGRSHDLSVLILCERVGDVLWVRAIIRLANTSYPAQLDLLTRLLQCHAVKRLCVDKGLIGAYLPEFLQQKFGKYRVEGVQLTAPVQSELAMPLRAAFEDRSIRVPVDPLLREALRKPRKIVVGNNIRFETPRDDAGHCDEFSALALMLMAAELRRQPLPAPTLKPAGW